VIYLLTTLYLYQLRLACWAFCWRLHN